MPMPIWVSRPRLFDTAVWTIAKASPVGRHRIRYAIFPHQGSLDSRTVRAAANFNNPMRVYSTTTTTMTSLLSCLKCSDENNSVVLDAVKRGEDDEDVSRGELPKRAGRSVIVRVYESLGGQSRGVIETSLPVQKVWKCNVLEDDEEPMKVQEGKIPFHLRAFEIATFRLQL